jgi:pimeloyl-ACP methyl ester carboxylesterase
VVFVHASVMDHSMWDEQVAALADDYGTVVYDLRGHGRTGGSVLPRYTMDTFADDLDALLAALDVDRPVLCGLSMGGLVALTYAARHPDRVAGLVLAEAFAPEILSRGEWLLRRVLLNALIPPVRLLGYERVERAEVWLAERLFGGVGGDYERVERLRATGPRMATDEFVKTMRAMSRFHDVTLDLSAVRTPTLVLYGEHGLPFVPRHAAALAARLPDVEVDEVPGAGHAANLDAPAYVTDAVRRFLDEVYAGEDAGVRGGAGGAGGSGDG